MLVNNSGEGEGLIERRNYSKLHRYIYKEKRGGRELVSVVRFDVCITESLNNVFVSVVDGVTGEVIYKCSGGLLGYEGPRRSSYTCALKVGEHVSVWLDGLMTEIRNKSVRLLVNIVLKTPYTSKVQSVLRGLCLVFYNYNELEYRYQRAHNGVRPRKRRKV